MFSVVNIHSKAPKLTAILKSLYTDTKVTIENSIESFQFRTGCREGGIESPVSFNIYMDFVLRYVEHISFKAESSTREQ